LRNLWKHYFDGVDGIIYVVDSHDSSRLDEAKLELQSLLKNPQLKNAIILVFANKKELPKAKSANEIDEFLSLSESGRIYNVQESCALNGDGLVEGFCWLSERFNQMDKQKSNTKKQQQLQQQQPLPSVTTTTTTLP
jgi:ADP-ribosylation factor protein 1